MAASMLLAVWGKMSVPIGCVQPHKFQFRMSLSKSGHLFFENLKIETKFYSHLRNIRNVAEIIFWAAQM
jgi:hypothetical protein